VAYGGVDGELRKVRLVVQPSMGEGAFTAMPLALSGVRALLEMMDWGELPEDVAAKLAKDAPPEPEAKPEAPEEADATEAKSLSTAPTGRRGRREGGGDTKVEAPKRELKESEKPIVAWRPGKGPNAMAVRGPEQLKGLITFGTLGEESVDDDVFLYISIAPQNIVGGNVLEPLGALTKAAEAKGQHVMVVNPRLQDRPSPNDVMQIRGREERQAFAKSFAENELYNLRLLYRSGVSYFPIRGSLYRKTYQEPYVLAVRKDVNPSDPAVIAKWGANTREVYESFATSEDRPTESDISSMFSRCGV